MAVIECIPNVSEGRRSDVLAACDSAVQRGGARLLDVKPDATHNRTVFTFAGDAAQVRAGCPRFVPYGYSSYRPSPAFR
jgi:glutamate formiminotransferase